MALKLVRSWTYFGKINFGKLFFKAIVNINIAKYTIFTCVCKI